MNLAERITSAVGTMRCAYVFAALALVSLPAAIQSHNVIQIVSWISTTFLQLVLLSIIMVGQDVQAQASEALVRETHDVVLEELALIRQIVAPPATKA